jgi:hypothetical protein
MAKDCRRLPRALGYPEVPSTGPVGQSFVLPSVISEPESDVPSGVEGEVEGFLFGEVPLHYLGCRFG